MSAHPITFRRRSAERGVVFRVEVAEVVPATAGPLGHGIGLAFGAVGQVQPVYSAGKGRLAVRGGFVILQRRREKGQSRFGQRFMVKIPLGILLPNNRERLAPISLAAEE